jgi:hypothetical protein
MHANAGVPSMSKLPKQHNQRATMGHEAESKIAVQNNEFVLCCF